jgi:NAD(P)-dependent dehydrogenase (short-subunit alcohol dehydrogenase family)
LRKAELRQPSDRNARIAISRPSRRNHEARRQKGSYYGGNSGIGLGTARLFISEGAEVAITGRDQQTLDEAVAKLGSKAHGYRADVTVAEDRKKLFAELAKDFGKLDIVFANAGISGRTPTGTTDEAIFEKIVHTNLNGAFFTVNSAVPLMNDNGSIIFNGSVHNYLGQPAWLRTLPRKADSSRWRDPSPQTLHRARFA